jgi:hypothetical protein
MGIALIISIKSKWWIILHSCSRIDGGTSFSIRRLRTNWFMTITLRVHIFFYNRLIWYANFNSINRYIVWLLKNKSRITYTYHFLRTITYHGSFIFSMRRLLNLLRILYLFTLYFSWTRSHIKWIFNKLLILILLVKIILTIINIIFNIFLINQRFLNLWINVESTMLKHLSLLLQLWYFLMILLCIHYHWFVFSMLYSHLLILTLRINIHLHWCLSNMGLRFIWNWVYDILLLLKLILVEFQNTALNLLLWRHLPFENHVILFDFIILRYTNHTFLFWNLNIRLRDCHLIIINISIVIAQIFYIIDRYENSLTLNIWTFNW